MRINPLGIFSIWVLPEGEERGTTLADLGRNILDRIKDRYGSSCVEEENRLRIPLDHFEYQVRTIEERNHLAILSAVLPTNRSRRVSGDPGRQVTALQKRINKLREVLSEEPISTFTVIVMFTSSQKNKPGLLKEYLSHLWSTARAAGIVRGQLLAVLDGAPSSKDLRGLSRDLLIVPLDRTPKEARVDVWELCEDIAHLAIYAGAASQLLESQRLVLAQTDASEKSTRMKVMEIFSSLRKSPDQIQISDLESGLREITTIFSGLSTIASAMRRDHIRARGYLRDIDSLFTRWNEMEIDDYPTVSSVEMVEYRSLVNPLEDFIDRVEALGGQINTALDAVRTYLTLQQQKLAIEEQKSSGEQTARMAQVLESMHKLEILVVAIYITEMARIAFGALVEEHMANMLAIAFIPVALLLAFLVARLIHRMR
ncbi:MAG: hypothetical protein ACE5OY_03810 [Candidatus Bathyarchaeia archaeon]